MFNRHVMFALVSPNQAQRHMADVSDQVMHLHDATHSAVECHLIVDGPPIDFLKLLMLGHCAAARRFAIGPAGPRLLALVIAVCSGHSIDEYGNETDWHFQ